MNTIENARFDRCIRKIKKLPKECLSEAQLKTNNINDFISYLLLSGSIQDDAEAAALEGFIFDNTHAVNQDRLNILYKSIGLNL